MLWFSMGIAHASCSTGVAATTSRCMARPCMIRPCMMETEKNLNNTKQEFFFLLVSFISVIRSAWFIFGVLFSYEKSHVSIHERENIHLSPKVSTLEGFHCKPLMHVYKPHALAGIITVGYNRQC